MGTRRLSHCASVSRKSSRKRAKRGTRLYFARNCASKRMAQASQTQRSLWLSGSTRCSWPRRSSRLRSSQRSAGERLRANWRRRRSALSDCDCTREFMSVAAPLMVSNGKRRAGPAGLEIGQGHKSQTRAWQAGILYDDGWCVGSGFLDGGLKRRLQRCDRRTAATRFGVKFECYRSFAVDRDQFGVRAVRFEEDADGRERFGDPGAELLGMQAIQEKDTAHEFIPAEPIKNGSAGIAGVNDDLEQALEPRPMKLHERLNQVPCGGSDRRIGSILELADQSLDGLGPLPKLILTGHGAAPSNGTEAISPLVAEHRRVPRLEDLAVAKVHVNTTGQARVKTAHGAHDIDAFEFVGSVLFEDWRVLDGVFIRTRCAIDVARIGVPRRWRVGMVIGDLAIANHHVV